MFLITTAPAPIITSSHIEIPSLITAPAPTKTLLPTLTLPHNVALTEIWEKSPTETSWSKTACVLIIQPLPIETLGPKWTLLAIKVPFPIFQQLKIKRILF